MSCRIKSVAVLALLLAFAVACSNKKSVNPLAGIGSKQPDKVLFDKAMDAMKHNRFDVARITLQTLINTYPDSEYIARAKLAVGDSWYAEGGTASLAQAEQEYRDFITFFPNMPEAAEAQLKIANIQFQQMEKPDRDYTHAKRAEDEYRNLILQFPDSKLVPEAKQRLMEVQEVLAEREFEIGRFYYLRQSYAASIARLRSLVEKYPLYSRADEALYTLGQNYEAEIARIRAAPNCVAPGVPPGCLTEGLKARYIEQPTKDAADAYSKIITRYPIMDRVDDAKKRLAALHQPIPRPTRAALAQNKAEDASRRETPMFGRLMSVVRKSPDVAQAAKVGEPSLVDPTPVSATDVTRETLRAAMGAATGEKTVSIEKVDTSGTPPPNEPAPRSDAPPVATSPFAQPNAPAADPNELKPTAIANPAPSAATPSTASDPNELKPNTADSQGTGDQALPPPPQVNEIQAGQTSSSASVSTDSSSSQATDEEISSSKKKKKKGLKKVVPF
jgi:outer membrane protein assembly factor BamD